MLKVRFLAIISTTLGCLLLGSSYIPSLEAVPATPSSGTAGSTSGAGTTGSSLLGGLIQIREITITPAVQSSLNSIAKLVIDNLNQTGGTSSSIVNLTTFVVSNLSVDSANTTLNSINLQQITNSTPIPLANNGLLVIINLNNSVDINFNGTVINILTDGMTNPEGATKIAAAILASGGNSTQAQIAAILAGTSQSVNLILVIILVDSLTGLLPSIQANLPTQNLRASFDNSTNLNVLTDNTSLHEKSLKSTLPTLIAQEKGVAVNVEKLNKAILAYNNLIDKSSPEALQALSKNKEFIIIGNSLRKLRAAMAI